MKSFKLFRNRSCSSPQSAKTGLTPASQRFAGGSSGDMTSQAQSKNNLFRKTLLRCYMSFLFLVTYAVIAETSIVRADGDVYFTSGSHILKNGNAVSLKGVNVILTPTWYAATGASLASFGVKIERLAFSPGVIDISQLQQIVNDNRKSGIVTIIDNHSWGQGNDGGFTGVDPQSEWWYDSYKSKLAQEATQFANQPDVWIETWNEPYAYRDANAASGNERWVGFEREAISIIRNAGNNNIVIVNAPNWGADDSAVVAKGSEVLNGNSNVVFDLHAYEGMCGPNHSEQEDRGRIQAIQNIGAPVLIGETGVNDNNIRLDPTPVMNAVTDTNASITAWVWASSDPDSLTNNSPTNWGNQYFSYLQK